MDVYGGIPVTGEAVALDLRVARLGSRLVGLLIDVAVQVALLIAVIAVGAAATATADEAITAAVLLGGTVLVIVGYPIAVELLTRGRSLGKLAMGLRVVRDDGGPVRFRHVTARALAMVVELWLTSGALGLFIALLSPQGKRGGDYLAGTLVVSIRVTGAAQLGPPLPMPPELAGWAARADLSGVSDVAAGQARSLLGRWHQLDPTVRERLARQQADQLQVYASPPPPGCPPAAYLAAVVAERSRRAVPYR